MSGQPGPRLLGIGDATVDIYLSQGMQYPGGNTVNVAVQAHRCGMAASWLGCLGRDKLGDLVFESLKAEGLDVSRVRRLDGPNPWSRVRHEGRERIFAGSNPGVRSHYDLGEEDGRFIAGHAIVHTSVHSDLDARMPWLRAHSRELSYDYSEHWRRPGVLATLGCVDLAFLSAPRREEGEVVELMRHFADRGPKIVVATRGVKGAMALSRRNGVEGVVAVPAVPTELVDTLGAGDALIAAFLVAHGQGRPLQECLSRGAAHAARVCAEKGGFGHGIKIVPGQPGLDASQVVHGPATPAESDWRWDDLTKRGKGTSQ